MVQQQKTEHLSLKMFRFLRNTMSVYFQIIGNLSCEGYTEV